MTDTQLQDYLERTGAVAEPPSHAALSRLLLAHVTTFPFDTIDVLLGQHPGVGLATSGTSSSAAGEVATASSTPGSSTPSSRPSATTPS